MKLDRMCYFIEIRIFFTAFIYSFSYLNFISSISLREEHYHRFFIMSLFYMAPYKM